MNFKITNWGHSCILIETKEGQRLLFDPYITGNESAAVGVDEICDIDAVIVTHGAFDHMGDAIEIVKKTGATLYCGPEVRDYALFNGVDESLVRMLVWGTCLEHKDTGIKIRSIEAKHLSYFKMGDTKITGMPMSYVVTLKDGTGIFFAGDTSIFSDMKLFGELYPVKYGFFGVMGLVGYPYEMDAREAALRSDVLSIPRITNRFIPMGGVIWPISMRMTSTMPNQIGSKPYSISTGNRMGMVRYCMELPSMKQPRIM